MTEETLAKAAAASDHSYLAHKAIHLQEILAQPRKHYKALDTEAV